MTETMTLRKIRRKHTAKSIKEHLKDDYIKRNAGKVVYVPYDTFMQDYFSINHERAEHVKNTIRKRGLSESI